MCGIFSVIINMMVLPPKMFTCFKKCCSSRGKQGRYKIVASENSGYDVSSTSSMNLISDESSEASKYSKSMISIQLAPGAADKLADSEP